MAVLHKRLLHYPISANKWGSKADGAKWQEEWAEEYYSDGRVDKSAYKWAVRGLRDCVTV
eukprot:1162176-Prorocentrum_minimum.AAC.1